MKKFWNLKGKEKQKKIHLILFKNCMLYNMEKLGVGESEPKLQTQKER